MKVCRMKHIYEKGDIFTVHKKEKNKTKQNKFRIVYFFLTCQDFVKKSHLHVNTVILQFWHFLCLC